MRSIVMRTTAAWIAAVVLLSVPVSGRELNLSARHAVLLDGETGRVLYAQDENTPALIASTTKIMTAILILEDCCLTDSVLITEEAANMEGSSMGLKAGEILTVEELLFGLMLHSGNDAAAALAIYHAGSEAAFADKMNEKALSLGLTQTHFDNPHGLDSVTHYASACDMAVLTAYALQNPEFHRIVSTKSITIGHRTLTNHNKLLWKYPGAVGVKTGYTKKAGRTLVSAAERDGRSLIAVTLRAPDDWSDHKTLLDYGFARFQNVKLASSGQVMGNVPVLCGAERACVVLREPIVCSLAPQEQVELRINIPPVTFAPIMAGEPAGTVSLYVDGKPVKEYPLFWRNTVLEDA